MSKKQKIIVMILFVTVIAVIGGVAGVANHQKTVKGQKQFEVEVVSERDNYSKTTECKSTEEFWETFCVRMIRVSGRTENLVFILPALTV